HHSREVVARVVLGRAAGVHHAAVGQDELQTQDMVDGHAVFERVGAAGVGGDVAADGAGPLAGRVGGKVIPVRLQVIRQPQVDHARVDDGVAVAVIDLEDALHPCQRQDDPAADGQAPSGEAGPGPAGQEGYVEFVADADDVHDLLGGGREHDH